MPGPFLALLVKELLVLVKAPRGLATLIVPPVLQLFLFGYAATFDVNRVPIAVMNEDQGPEGRELAARFGGSPSFEVVALPTQEAELKRLIDRGDVVMGLHIGQRFSAELAAGSLPDLQIVVDGRKHKVSGYEDGNFVFPTILDGVPHGGEPKAERDLFLRAAAALTNTAALPAS